MLFAVDEIFIEEFLQSGDAFFRGQAQEPEAMMRIEVLEEICGKFFIVCAQAFAMLDAVMPIDDVIFSVRSFVEGGH